MPNPNDRIPGVPTSTLDPFKDTRPSGPTLIDRIKHRMIAKFLQNALVSWKTTLAGLTLLIIEINHMVQGQPVAWENVTVAIGLILAKDGGVSNAAAPIPVAKAV